MPETLTPAPYPRRLAARVQLALKDTPVVLISGPRQAGKTTLVRQIAGEDRRYLTLDDSATLDAAREDPQGLIRSLDRVAIDEIQRAPELLLAIKKSVDEDRRPGRFILTGSANLMTRPRVADALVGRMESLMLPPLADCEIAAEAGEDSPAWVDGLFQNRIPRPTQKPDVQALTRRVLTGGYPEAILRPDGERRQEWTRQYIDTLVQRDAREIAGLEKMASLEKLLAMLARTSGQLCNYSQLGAQAGIDHKTAEKYLGIFEKMFLVRRLTPWTSNKLSRLIKTPKVMWWDSGLLASMLDTDADAVAADRTRFGNLLENHVHGEILKRFAWSSKRYSLSFYRDKDGVEVDFILENAMGDLVGIEVKANAGIRSEHFAGLRRFAELAGPAFKAGIVLYDGEHTLPMGDKLWAVPLSTLTSCRLPSVGDRMPV